MVFQAVMLVNFDIATCNHPRHHRLRQKTIARSHLAGRRTCRSGIYDKRIELFPRGEVADPLLKSENARPS